MKTTYIMFIFLFLFSCSEKPSDIPSSFAMSSEDEGDNDDTSTCNCFVEDTQVAAEGVDFWEKAWYRQFDLDTTGDSEPNQLIFSGERVKYLLDNSDDPEAIAGVRVYYGMESETDTIPILLMVAVDTSCNDMHGSIEDSSVIVRTPTEEYFSSMDNANSFTTQWRTFNDADDNVLTAINAYNYELNEIQDLLEADENGNYGLFFEFGLRTIAPQESCFPVPSDGSYGSIIYCNLVYGYTTDSENGEGRMDFAMPCPQMCDDDSPLMTEVN